MKTEVSYTNDLKMEIIEDWFEKHDILTKSQYEFIKHVVWKCRNKPSFKGKKK